MFDLNVELAVIDAVGYRAALRATNRYYKRLLDCHRTGCDLTDSDIWKDVEESLNRSIHAACIKARNCWSKFQASRAAAFSESEVRYLLRRAPKDRKHALDQLYAKIASSATTSTMAKVRNRLMTDITNRRVRSPNSRLLRQDIRESLKKLGVSAERGSAIATSIRAQTSIAFNATIWREGLQDPELWGWEYVTAGDERVRPQHARMEGVRYPKNHVFWRSFVPPNGWNCRCTIRPIYLGSADAVIRPYIGTPFVDPEFRFNPGGIFFLVS